MCVAFQVPSTIPTSFALNLRGCILNQEGNIKALIRNINF